MMSNINKRKGFSLVELLIYISIMSIIAVVIVSIVLVVLRSNKESFSKSKLNISAVSAIDRINREIKSAKTVVNPNATSTVLSVDESGVAKIVRIYLDNGIVKIDENGAYVGQLSSDDSYISTLNFTYIDNVSSKAIRTAISIKTSSASAISETFYTTAILRGSY